MPLPCLPHVSSACFLPSIFLGSPWGPPFAKPSGKLEGREAFDAGVKFSQGRGQRGEDRTGIVEEQEEAISIRDWDQERHPLVFSPSQFHRDAGSRC